MPAATPSFIFDFESRMQTITENEYAAFAANMWWSNVMRTRPSGSRRELVAFLISTAKIEDLSDGNMVFEDMVSKYVEYEAKMAGAGLKLQKNQLEDNDGNGLELATKWSADMGAYMAYWPQKRLVKAIKDGELSTSLGYDGVPFFSKLHRCNPGKEGGKTYANIFTAVAPGATDPNNAIYPGAVPIHSIGAGAVTVDVALENLQKVVAYIRAIRMPNGVDPRFLRIKGIFGAASLHPRLVQLTQAKTIAQASAGGAASADVEALIKSLSFGTPWAADEFSDDPTTYYVVTEQIASSELGGFVYVDREPFHINYYSNEDDAVLNRARELEWHCHGRNVVGYGHPFAIFKCKAT